MRQGSILAGAAFKAAFLGFVVFSASLLIAGFAISGIVRSAMQAELEGQLKEEAVLFKKVYDEGGQAALIDIIHKLEDTPIPNLTTYGVFSRSNERLAGEINIPPDFLGFRRTEMTFQTANRSGAYYLHASKYENTTIVVGRRLSMFEAVSKALRKALLIAGLFGALISLAIGYALSKGTMAKLTRMADTLDLVAQGDTKTRLYVGQSNDQIDRISRRINDHLEQLSILTQSTRNTIRAVAHDLRSPLNRANLLLQEASDRIGTDEAAKDILADAEDELSNLNGTFDAILRISRIESSDDRSAFLATPVAAMVQEIVETYLPVVEEAGQTLLLDTDSAAGASIVCDRKMVFQMLANLIENASFYCPAGSTITVRASADLVGCICLEVADDGPGIPSEFHSEATEPFFRLDKSRTEQRNGLGLALVKAIATRHGATLTLGDNHPGLRVSICFPPVGLESFTSA